MRRRGLGMVLSMSMLLLAGCGGGAKDSAVPKPSASNQPAASQSAPPAASASPAASSALKTGTSKVAMASGLLQKCLGITPGAAKMIKSAAAQPACQQLPGADLYNQAGQLFQAGDHAGAAQVVTKAADAGNAVAQLRLALMYDQGDGVPRSAAMAYHWYAQAAAQGEPESLNQVGIFYEIGEGVDEDWDLAANLWKASAEQGWLKGQFSYGRAFEFGIGVAQDRQQAIAWFRKAGAQGDPDGKHWAEWLSDTTNNIGFRDDIERSIVMDEVGRLRFSGVLIGGDPYGVTFHNSAQRTIWLEGQRDRANKDEADVFRKIHQREHADCVAQGRDNCVALRF